MYSYLYSTSPYRTLLKKHSDKDLDDPKGREESVTKYSTVAFLPERTAKFYSTRVPTPLSQPTLFCKQGEGSLHKYICKWCRVININAA